MLTVPTLILGALVGVSLGCSTDTSRGEHGEHLEARGEHDRDGSEHGEGHGSEGHGSEGHGSEGGEESGTELALNATYDKVRNGAHLVLAYDAASNSFRGKVTNTTAELLERVRVEVHLSNGKEIGPTIPQDLAPGASIDVDLKAESKGFERWNAHPEVGSGEHGHGEGGEHGGEHREGRGEHGGRERRGEHR